MKLLKKMFVFLIITAFLSSNLAVYAASKQLYAWLSGVEHLKHSKYEVVSILFDAQRDVSSFVLKAPDRIVIDVKYALFDGRPQTINGGEIVKTIRYAQYEKNTVRIVLDTKGEQNFRIDQEQGVIKVYIGELSEADKEQEREQDREQEQNSRGGIVDRGDKLIQNPVSKNVIYSNLGDRVYLSIQGTSLTEGGENYKKFFTEKYSDDGLTYTLSFRSNLAKLQEGTIRINDRYLESITINKTLLSFNTNIIFKAKDKFVFHVMARPDVKDTAITILKPASNNEKLVVIDAGHGGVEPGAVYSGLQEKNINLDIALKLNELLKKENVNTYMIREDDKYVSFYERAFIANKLKASLFLSIHNNALEDRSFDGTMMLYSINSNESKKFNSLNFAKIIQNRLINDLDTKDRKVRERNDLVVLRLTKMPAALAEIAFMTNSNDLAKLKNADFKQKTAQALCDSIIKALAEIK